MSGAPAVRPDVVAFDVVGTLFSLDPVLDTREDLEIDVGRPEEHEAPGKPPMKVATR